MDKREIGQLGLVTVGSWQDKGKILDYLQKKSERYRLTVGYHADKELLSPAEVRATSERICDFARYWFTDGERGSKPNPRSGTLTPALNSTWPVRVSTSVSHLHDTFSLPMGYILIFGPRLAPSYRTPSVGT